MDIRIYIICILFICAQCSEPSCSLNNLYKDIDANLMARATLSNLFGDKYNTVLKAAEIEAPYLLPPAEYFHSDIRKYFIEFGHKLENPNDLEKLLESFNYLAIPRFRQLKEDFELRHEFIKD